MPLLRTDKEIAEIYQRHSKTVYRVCYSFMKHPADTEDAVQNTFFQLIKAGPVFDSHEHEKAWLIRTASNVCKNVLRSWWRKRDNLDENFKSNDAAMDDIFGVVMALPDKYKTVVYLYYYEGYSSVEISKALGKPQSTIRNHLHEARNILRSKLGGDFS